MKISSSSTMLSFLCLLSLLIYILFCWNFQLADLPGLHGDEAWMGIRADSYLHIGKVPLLGMNSYTGILQSLASALSFKIFGTGMFGLRIAGPVLNFLAILIVFSFIRKKSNRIFFLVIALQSSLLLISPRIAWEVNTFTLFFLSIAIVSTFKIIENLERPDSGWTFIFLLVNILGTYNHVIFLCVPLSAFIGLFFWTFLERNFVFIKLIIIFLINLGNLTLLFFIMKYGIGSSWSDTTYLLIFGVFSLLFFEISSIRKIPNIQTDLVPWFETDILRFMVFGLLLIFFYHHGFALLDLFSNYKLIMNIYSYSPPKFVENIFRFCGIATMATIAYFLCQDIKKGGKDAIPAMSIISYLCIFSIFTTNNSLRYYLAIYIIFSIYVALRLNLRFKEGKIILAVLILAGMLTQITIWEIYLNNDAHPAAALKVKVGNNMTEDSGHFLPKAPLVEFLQKNNIGHIYYDSERYFLEQPILFYQLTKPWRKDPSKSAVIDFSYSPGNNTGGFLYFIK